MSISSDFLFCFFVPDVQTQHCSFSNAVTFLADRCDHVFMINNAEVKLLECW